MARRKKKLTFEEVDDFDEVFDPEVPWTGYVRRSWIVPNPDQPRKEFGTDDLVELKDSIDSVGQQRAVSVIPHRAENSPLVRLMIHDGERGCRAIEMMGEDEPILVIYNPEIDRERLHLQSFAANFGRKGHTHVETIVAVCHELDDLGTTVKELSIAVTRTEAWVYQYKSLGTLHPELQVKMDAKSTKERLTMQVALMICKLPLADQLEAYSQVAGKKSKQATAIARTVTRQFHSSNGGSGGDGGGRRNTANRNDRRRLQTFLENAAIDVADFNSVADGVFDDMDPATAAKLLANISELGTGLTKIMKKLKKVAPKGEAATAKPQIGSDLAKARKVAAGMFSRPNGLSREDLNPHGKSPHVTY